MAQKFETQRKKSGKEAGIEPGLAELDGRYQKNCIPPSSPRIETETVLNAVIDCLKSECKCLDLSDLHLYYDGLADEYQTTHGTPVYRCPVWYGGIDSDPESITLSVYEIDQSRLCLSLMHFFMHKRFEEKELFIKPVSEPV